MAAAAAGAAPGGLLHIRPSSTLPTIATRFTAKRVMLSARSWRPHRRGPALGASVGVLKEAYTEPEAALLEALVGVQGRGRGVAPRQLQEVENAVQALESLEGLPDPTNSSLIEGCWQLIFTTRPGTASPIQEVYLRTDDPRVTNIVKFSESVGELRVEAEATVKDGKRILFRFDRAAFTFKFLPFKVPYPVPFRLLGDEAKGWLDTTYLSCTGNIRISRGNKGTTFILQKIAEPRQMLLSAISTGTGVEEVIDDLTSGKKGIKVDLNTLVGEWQLLWTSQTEGESWTSIAAAGLKGLQILKEDGQLKNVINLFPSLSLNARGNLCRKASSSNTFSVTMNEGDVRVGVLRFPLDIQGEFLMEILYVDNKIRISRLNQYMFVHLRIGQANRT